MNADFQPSGSRPHCVILHPSLGYGGAERLVLQLAEGLVAGGWRCTLLVPGRERGDRKGFAVPAGVQLAFLPTVVPPSVLGRLKAWCVYLRMKACLRTLKKLQADLVVIDILPHLIPALKARFPGLPVLAYCHFPDRLLAPVRKAAWYVTWYSTYRNRFDALEEQGLMLADAVLVNSAFTRRKLLQVYPRLKNREVDVVHPGIDCARFMTGNPAELDAERTGCEPSAKNLILTLGRIHPSKNHLLALAAFGAARCAQPVRLAICGGYDETDSLCREEARRITARIAELGLAERVELHFNPDDAMLETLWQRAALLLYPPPEEHFGLVPLEAMVRGVPVIAVNDGGPTEVVVHGETGLLLPAEVTAFRRGIEQLLGDQQPAQRAQQVQLAQRFAAAGYLRAVSVFPLSAFHAKVAAHAGRLAGFAPDENRCASQEK